MKTLITHINPHLDDIAAIWLYKKFVPGFSDAKLEFIPASKDAAKTEESEDKIFLGTGGGKFDEHKGDLEDCATSLVWKYLIKENLAPEDIVEKKALDELVEWGRLIDLGKFPETEYGDFNVAAFIRPKDATQEGSAKACWLGAEILDRILEVLKNKQQSIKDWEDRVEFDTKFGKSFAVVSETVNRPFCKAMGGDLFLMLDPKHGGVQFFTPSHEIDLEPIYKKVMELDPDADWYLHQSHHMVLCGAGSKPDVQKTKLSFEQLIEASKNA